MTEEQKKLVDQAADAAERIQIRDDVCSRSTMAGLAETFDFIPKEIVTASAGLCGGTASANGSCGAYCAGLLAVGLKFNASIDEELAHPGEGLFDKTTAAHMVEYRERFLKEYGTVLCPKIHQKLFGRSFDLTNPTDQQAFFLTKDHEKVCGKVVATAARIAAEMIVEGSEE